MYALESNQTTQEHPTWVHDDFSVEHIDADGDMIPIYHHTRAGAESAMHSHRDYPLIPESLRIDENATPCGEHVVID